MTGIAIRGITAHRDTADITTNAIETTANMSVTTIIAIIMIAAIARIGTLGVTAMVAATGMATGTE